MDSFKRLFNLGDKVCIVGIIESDPLYGRIGTYAGTSSDDGYQVIIVLDEPTETHLAMVFPVVCLEAVN